ncbi:MAG: hypothetical protein EAZ57_09710 [Cytophagales bacterium]|nr:MAG: hypothetical protein EAZ67_10220 [Cytophagales bacterium]TAF59811.1 MAG: hypothetical protein EAZ57_09710 [Cytophagales bacterium]
MKLRIKGDSIRLRLTQSEVKALEQNEIVSETTHFATQNLVYKLGGSNSVSEIYVDFAEGILLVLVPAQLLNSWASSDQVGIENKARKILIEKDFQCLTPRAPDEDLDTFPNPNAHC